MARPRSLRRLRLDTLHRMGDRFRVKVVSVVALVAIAATGLVIACGSGEGGGEPACEGPTCDGGGAETSPPDGSQPQPDGSPLGDGGDAGSDGDAAVVANCGDGGAAGSLDESFGDGGMVWLKYPQSTAEAVAVQTDSKIVIGGRTGGSSGDFALVRLLSAGAEDPSFGTNGLVEHHVGDVNSTIKAIAIQADGRIVAVGYTRPTAGSFTFATVRHLPDGGVDPTFGTAGLVLTDFPSRDAYAQSVAIQSDGKILVAGYTEGATTSSTDLAIVRYNADGSLDTNFGNGGRAAFDLRTTADMPGVVAVMSTGKIVVGGGSAQDTTVSTPFDVSAVRLNQDGSVDTTFADAGTLLLPGVGKLINTPVASVTADGLGTLLLAGSFRLGTTGDDFGVCRVTSTGALDPAFGDGGVVSTDFGVRGDSAAALVVEPGGKIILAGVSSLGVGTRSIALARYTASGALDTSFGTNGTVLTSPPANADLTASAASLHGCGLVTAGTWPYDRNTVLKTAMGIARYRR